MHSFPVIQLLLLLFLRNSVHLYHIDAHVRKWQDSSTSVKCSVLATGAQKNLVKLCTFLKIDIRKL